MSDDHGHAYTLYSVQTIIFMLKKLSLYIYVKL